MVNLKNIDKVQCQSYGNDRDYPLVPRMGDCEMITTELLDPRSDDTERNLKPIEELGGEEVKLFGDNDHRLIRIRKNLPVELLEKYHEYLA